MIRHFLIWLRNLINTILWKTNPYRYSAYALYSNQAYDMVTGNYDWNSITSGTILYNSTNGIWTNEDWAGNYAWDTL